jgi:hypothetical protein
VLSDPIIQKYYFLCVAPGYEFYRDGLMIVSWPKHVVKIKKINIVVFEGNRKLFYFILVCKHNRLLFVKIQLNNVLLRFGESRGTYRILVGKREGKRPLGRPRRRWEDNIKMDL